MATIGAYPIGRDQVQPQATENCQENAQGTANRCAATLSGCMLLICDLEGGPGTPARPGEAEFLGLVPAIVYCADLAQVLSERLADLRNRLGHLA